MNWCIKSGVVACLAGCASVASATDRVWVGPDADGHWDDPSNWNPSGHVGYLDTAIFRPSGELRIWVDHSTCNNGNYVRHMRFESGTTYLTASPTNTSYTGYFRLTSGTNAFYVAKDAAAFIGNQYVSDSAGMAVPEKTGEGELTFTAINNWDWGYVGGWVCSAGRMTFDCMTVERPVLVREGGMIVFKKSGAFSENATRLTAEAGGVFDFSGISQSLEGFEGAGVLTNVNALTQKLRQGRHDFSGRIYPSGTQANLLFAAKPSEVAAEDWRFVVGSTASLSNCYVELPSGPGSPVSFASGIGTFRFGTIQGNTTGTLALEDLEGNPVTVVANYVHPQRMRFSGCGSFALYGAGQELEAQGSTVDLSLTGKLMCTGPDTNTGLSLGSNTAGMFPDLSSVSGFVADRGVVLFKNANGVRTTVAGELTGANGGEFAFYGPLTFTNVRTLDIPWEVKASADLEISSGDARIGGRGIVFQSGAKMTLKDRTRLTGPLVKGREYSYLMFPKGLTVYNADAQGATWNITGGSLMSTDGTLASTVNVTVGGTLAMHEGAYAPYGTEANPYVLTFDGGRLKMLNLTSPYNTTIYSSNKLSIEVGAGGMGIDLDMQANPASEGYANFYVNRQIFAGCANDGGIRRTGAGWLRFGVPPGTTGLFDNRDGALMVENAAAMTDATTPLFGLGDLRLGNARIYAVTEVPAGTTLRYGSQGRFRYDGSAMVCVRNGSSAPMWNFVLGTLTHEPGGALFLSDESGAWSGVQIETATAPATDAVGRLLEPAFGFSGGRVRFMTVQAGGLTPLTNLTEGLSGGADSVALVSQDVQTLSSDASVAALEVRGVQSTSTVLANVLTLADGATLTVGTGTAPACVLLNNEGGSAVASIGGAGTLDFGAREGIVAVNNYCNVRYSARIDAKISGMGGLSVVAPPRLSAGISLQLGGANTYAGGTRVNGIAVRPTNAAAFSSGSVTLGDGELSGGALWMSQAGLVIPNAIRAAGWGPRENLSGDTFTDYGHGALFFTASGELSGPVEAYAPLRVSAALSGVEAVLSGVVSGDSIQLWKSAGKVVFTSANTYTGGTEVVSSTLVLRNGGSAGTGDIALDDGTLEIDSAEAVSVANRVRGVGTLRVKGKGAVSFADLSAQNDGFALDLCQKVTTIASLDGISALTTSRTGPTVLVVSDGRGKSFAGTVPANVTIYDPGEYRPGGMAIIVR